MSFGFGVGDFLAVIELVTKIRKDFVDAPSQFKYISDDTRSLSIALQDVSINVADRDLTRHQQDELQQITNRCHEALSHLDHTLGLYRDFISATSKSSRVKRAWKRVNWEPQDIRDLRSRISVLIGILNSFVLNLNASILNESSLVLQGIRDSVEKIQNHQDDLETEIILNWLSPVSYGLQQSDIIRKREPETGNWLLSSPEFHEWVETSQRTLFCPGIPGAGKTILTSVVIDELFARFQNHAHVGMAYIYCSFKHQSAKTLEGMLGSLLKQFARRLSSIPDSIRHMYNKNRESETRPSAQELSQGLRWLISQFTRAFILIDGLDECDATNKLRSRLLDEIFDLQKTNNVNFFATSRLIPSITSRFEGAISLKIRAREEDLRKYIQGRMPLLPSCASRSTELQEEIVSCISKSTGEMFLLAHLHINTLIGKRSPKAIRNALKMLPTGSDAYDQAYKEAMDRVVEQPFDQREMAYQVISWIACARRPLSTLELQHALAVEISEKGLDEENISDIEDMLTVCAGLVTVDEESGIIHLVHHTAQEYFDRTWTHWFPKAHHDIATVCLTYLSFYSLETPCLHDSDLCERLNKFPLYSYAAQNWGHHARLGSVDDLILDLFQNEGRVSSCAQVALFPDALHMRTNWVSSGPRNITGLHLAAMFGLESIAIATLEDGHEINCMDSEGRTPLSWAAQYGQDALVKLLLANGADLGHSRVQQSRTPLTIAAENGHVTIVELLLETYTNPDITRNAIEWAMLTAASNGHTAVIELLLQKGGTIHFQSPRGRSLLCYAAERGHMGLAKFLLAHVNSPNALDHLGITPLTLAASNNHTAMVRLLLEHGGDISIGKPLNGKIPLAFAAMAGHEEIVRILLENGADLEAREDNGHTALSYAVWSEREAIVQLLLSKGANTNIVVADGRTLLSFAMVKKNEVIMRLLLDSV